MGFCLVRGGRTKDATRAISRDSKKKRKEKKKKAGEKTARSGMSEHLGKTNSFDMYTPKRGDERFERMEEAT